MLKTHCHTAALRCRTAAAAPRHRPARHRAAGAFTASSPPSQRCATTRAPGKIVVQFPRAARTLLRFRGTSGWDSR